MRYDRGQWPLVLYVPFFYGDGTGRDKKVLCMVKPRENRVPIMMSDEELEAIDEWRHENRIATRSEAVRRLVQIGMFLEAGLDQVVDTTSDGVDLLSSHSAELSNVFRQVINRETYGMTFDRDQLWDIFTLAREQADDAEGGIRELHRYVVTLFNAVAAMVDARSTRGAARKSQQVVNKANKAVDDAEKRKAAREKELAENRYLSIAITRETPEERQNYEALPESKKDAYLKARIASLAAEEREDPEAFAERYGIDNRKFWEKPEWNELLEKIREEGARK